MMTALAVRTWLPTFGSDTVTASTNAALGRLRLRLNGLIDVLTTAWPDPGGSWPATSAAIVVFRQAAYPAPWITLSCWLPTMAEGAATILDATEPWALLVVPVR